MAKTSLVTGPRCRHTAAAVARHGGASSVLPESAAHGRPLMQAAVYRLRREKRLQTLLMHVQGATIGTRSQKSSAAAVTTIAGTGAGASVTAPHRLHPTTINLLSSPPTSLKAPSGLSTCLRHSPRTSACLTNSSSPSRRHYTTSSPKMGAAKIDGTAIAKAIREKLGAEIADKLKANPRYKPTLRIIQGDTRHHIHNHGPSY